MAMAVVVADGFAGMIVLLRALVEGLDTGFVLGVIDVVVVVLAVDGMLLVDFTVILCVVLTEMGVGLTVGGSRSESFTSFTSVKIIIFNIWNRLQFNTVRFFAKLLN